MQVRTHSKNHPRYKRPIDDSVDDRCTPAAEFWAFNRRFAFSIDAAASHANARLPRFWTQETNALEQSWEGERIWCNPPYSRLRPWYEKAWLEIKAPLIVLLVPSNRTESPEWQDMIEPYRDRGGSKHGVPSGSHSVQASWRGGVLWAQSTAVWVGSAHLPAQQGRG